MSRMLSIVLLVATAAVSSVAQIRVDVGLVNVVATVLDDQGRYVADLAPEDFIVFEDGEVQAINHFAQSRDLPVSVGVLLDTSASMELKIYTATEAVERFLRQIHPDDDVFLVAFDDRPRLLQDFTDDRDRLARALRSTRVRGGTALYDAVALGVDHIRNGRHDNKAILLISDGQNTMSTTSLERAQRYVRESETLVYALGIAPEGEEAETERNRATPPTSPSGEYSPGRISGRPSPPRPRDLLRMDVLEVFGAISGGWARLVSGLSDNNRQNQIAEALEDVADELRNQYSIGYYPPHPLDDGRLHRIEVITTNPAYSVRHRGEYYGGSEPD